VSFASLFRRREGKKGVDWALSVEETPQNPIAWFLGQKGVSFHRFLGLVIGSLNLALVILLLYCVIFGTMEIRILRSAVLTLFLLLAFLTYPLGKKSWKEPLTPLFLVDSAFIFFALAVQVYTYANIDRFTFEIADLSFWEAFCGITTFILILEACRRTMGYSFSLLCLLFLLQPLFAHYMPGILYGPPVKMTYLIEQQFLRDDGIFGLALGVMVTTLSIFLVFGAFLQKTSVGQFFISLALSAAGRFTGGPAKVAIISSGLMGSISGSVTANVVTTGAITIPMMKSAGFKKEFAGAVEAVASSGGQLMPPVMGVSAFLVAAIMGIPYFEVCQRAVIPAFLYFGSVFLIVHLRARRIGLKALPPEDIPSFVNTVREGGYLTIPLVVIIYMLIQGYSAEKSVVIALFSIFILSFIRSETRLTPARFLDALEEGARIMIPIGIACAGIGLIIGSLGVSGVAMRLTSFVVQASGGHLWIALVYTMAAGIILGMGVPTAVVYIFLAVIVVPALIEMGVAPIAAHLFAFYWGVIGNITPPVALGSFAAAAIARASIMKTALSGVRVGIACFLIPYLFVYAPELLLTGSFGRTVQVLFTAAIGIWALGSATEGYFLKKANLLERFFLFVAALVLIKPGWYTDTLGLVIFCLVLLAQIRGMPVPVWCLFKRVFFGKSDAVKA